VYINVYLSESHNRFTCSASMITSHADQPCPTLFSLPLPLTSAFYVVYGLILLCAWRHIEVESMATGNHHHYLLSCCFGLFC